MTGGHCCRFAGSITVQDGRVLADDDGRTGAEPRTWPDSNVPFGALRLWDNGTAWSQIETVKGKYNWALVDRAVAKVPMAQTEYRISPAFTA